MSLKFSINLRHIKDGEERLDRDRDVVREGLLRPRRPLFTFTLTFKPKPDPDELLFPKIPVAAAAVAAVLCC